MICKSPFIPQLKKPVFFLFVMEGLTCKHLCEYGCAMQKKKNLKIEGHLSKLKQCVW